MIVLQSLLLPSGYFHKENGIYRYNLVWSPTPILMFSWSQFLTYPLRHFASVVKQILLWLQKNVDRDKRMQSGWEHSA